MDLNQQWGDMALLWLVKDQTHHSILHYLKQLPHIHLDFAVVIVGDLKGLTSEIQNQMSLPLFVDAGIVSEIKIEICFIKYVGNCKN